MPVLLVLFAYYKAKIQLLGNVVWFVLRQEGGIALLPVCVTVLPASALRLPQGHGCVRYLLETQSGPPCREPAQLSEGEEEKKTFSRALPSSPFPCVTLDVLITHCR